MRWRSQGRRRSVDRGTPRPAIELRYPPFRGADAVATSGRPHGTRRHGRAALRPRAVEEPEHGWKLLAREPGDPFNTRRRWWGGSARAGPKPYVWHARGREVG